MKYDHHPLSDKLPWMTEDEWYTFLESMKRDGYNKLKPITLFEGKILDGRHRQKAALELGLKFPTVNFITNGITPLKFVIQENINRRHMTLGQKAALSVEMYDELKPDFMVHNKSGNLTEFLGDCNTKTALITARSFGIGRHSVVRAISVRKYAPDIFEQLKQGKINISQALKLTPKIRLSPKKTNKKNLENVSLEIAKAIYTDPFEMPKTCDSYERIMDDLKKINYMGYVAQAVFCAGKVYFQIIKQGANFKPWGSSRWDNNFKQVAVAEMRKEVK